MPSRKDELAERRFAKLVDQLKARMAACLIYRAFYGQLILTHAAVAELGELAEIRRAARAAGWQLGWRFGPTPPTRERSSSSTTASRPRRYGVAIDSVCRRHGMG
ncbi:hypothetical protein [Nonomuraea insulae]|uniref:Uncharacterized protein n=1 Tax=Nonomuraea insulae TaxID=1616787 RepID=A0ABW1D878_9ACTN